MNSLANAQRATGKGMRAIILKGSLFLGSILGTADVQAQCNTMPGNNVGDLGCVTFIYQGQPVTYTTVRAADGNVWLQQNLGSTAIATSKTDTSAYGHLFQWGRWDDGHQLRNSVTDTVPATNNPSGITAGTNTYFTGTSTAAWWNGGQLTDTWSGTTASATNGIDPCKAIGTNWHLPTQAEWADVVTDEAITNPDLAFSSSLKLTVSGSRSSSTGGFDFVGTRGYYWSSTTSSTGGKYYYFSAAVNNTSAGNTRGGGAAVRCINVSGTVSIVDSVKVSTQNNVVATIATNAGTLQMTAAVYPATISQDVTWSIIPGTGTATINTSGLVTAQGNGTVWAKAISMQTPTKSDSMLITISNQVTPPIAIDSIVVRPLNNTAPTINTFAGTLQLEAIIYPNTANQNVTWSTIPVAGVATINASGLLTAQQNGSVWVRATSVGDITKSDSIQISITNQNNTGIQELGTLIGFNIYPNPAEQTVFIALEGKHTVLKISLTDIYGRVIYTQNAPAQESGSILKLNVQDISSGVYFIRISGSNIDLLSRLIRK